MKKAEKLSSFFICLGCEPRRGEHLSRPTTSALVGISIFNVFPNISSQNLPILPNLSIPGNILLFANNLLTFSLPCDKLRV
nr:MAG TPA: hypothetical protein [Caudoviricetes sp.]